MFGRTMAKKIKCSICGKVAEDYDLFCGKCGSDLPKDNWDRREQIDCKQTYPVVSTNTTTDYSSPSQSSTIVMVPKKVKQPKKMWYKPPKRARPAYHPLEWFFWIGWGLYIILRFIGTETFNYFAWCCCWGAPRELKESRRKRRRE